MQLGIFVLTIANSVVQDRYADVLLVLTIRRNAASASLRTRYLLSEQLLVLRKFYTGRLESVITYGSFSYLNYYFISKSGY